MKISEEQKVIFKKNVKKHKKNLNLLRTMVSRNVKTIYRESVLGIVWTVLNPLLTMFVLSFVYSSVFGSSMINMNYSVYVLSGMVIFNTFFRTGSSAGLESIVNSRSLVLQTQIPITAYPRVSVYTALINFFFAYIALVIVMLVVKQPFTVTMLLVLVEIPALLMFTMGSSYILAAVYVYFRDIKNLYNVFMTLLNYMTPIFYTMTSLHNELAVKLLKYNPLYYYVDYFRETIIGNVPSIEYHLLIYGMGIFMYALGYVFLVQSKKRFIFHM